MSKQSGLREESSAVSPAKAESPAEAAGSPDGRRRFLGKRKDIPSLALVKDNVVRDYQAMYKDIFGPGTIDRKTKELIAIAAAAVAGCEGCLLGHLRKARALGATTDEIKETVGIAFAVNAASVVDRTDVAAALLKLEERAEGAGGDA